MSTVPLYNEYIMSNRNALRKHLTVTLFYERIQPANSISNLCQVVNHCLGIVSYDGYYHSRFFKLTLRPLRNLLRDSNMHLLNRQLFQSLARPVLILLKPLIYQRLRAEDNLPPLLLRDGTQLRKRRGVVAHLQDSSLLRLVQKRLCHSTRAHLVCCNGLKVRHACDDGAGGFEL
ncbi:hypothetical protein HG530_014354 [Fusarium avenaceum]|nr:hypothetical protein HG530_014354 [Fusarium avenaceum]